MPKLQAPAQVSGAGLPTGREFACEPGGVLTAPDDVTAEEVGALLNQGFEALPDEAPTPAPAASAILSASEAVKATPSEA